MEFVKEYNIHQATFKNGSKNKENQDTKSIWFKKATIIEEGVEQVVDKLVGFIGVYDGHGNYNGLFISQFTKEFMEKFIVKHWTRINADFEGTINELFSLLSDELRVALLKKTEVENFAARIIQVEAPEGKNYNYLEYKYKHSDEWVLVRGGTTISLQFFLDNGDSYHVHVGDSECMLLKKTLDNILSDEIVVNNNRPNYKTSYEVPTQNHSPDSIEQYNRVTTNYGENAGLFIYDENTPYRSHINIFKDNKMKDSDRMHASGCKLYHKNVEGDWATLFSDRLHKSHLAFVCSMGDYYLLHSGLSHTPTIVKTDLTNVSSILLASDGLWDNWKKEEVKDAYFKLENEEVPDKDIFNQLMLKTTIEAMSNFGPSRDDITAIMVIF